MIETSHHVILVFTQPLIGKGRRSTTLDCIKTRGGGRQPYTASKQEEVSTTLTLHQTEGGGLQPYTASKQGEEAHNLTLHQNRGRRPTTLYCIKTGKRSVCVYTETHTALLTLWSHSCAKFVFKNTRILP